MLPSLQKSGEHREIDRFDLLSQCRKCAPPGDVDDASRRPFWRADTRTKMTLDQLASSLPFGEPRFNPVFIPPISIFDFFDCRRAMGRQIPRQNFTTRGSPIENG